ncbi:DUF423 domain-containing protein [Devosia sp.]|uniref:DUF423 domain-containing protein n=1 Tax=Devosia sp. TaxID=1871048 RepID=UPI003267A0FB
MQLSRISRAVIGLGGGVGALGVVAAAAGSHGVESRNYSSIAAICLSHGPLLVALGLYGLRNRWFTAATAMLALGTTLFAGDLLVLQQWGSSPFALAAPIGGTAMILGWLLIIVAAVMTPTEG